MNPEIDKSRRTIELTVPNLPQLSRRDLLKVLAVGVGVVAGFDDTNISTATAEAEPADSMYAAFEETDYFTDDILSGKPINSNLNTRSLDPGEKDTFAMPSLESIYETLRGPFDQEVIANMKEGYSKLSLEDFYRFMESGIQNKSEYVKSVLDDADYYKKVYEQELVTVEYIVLHCWAYGVKYPLAVDERPAGISKDFTLTDLVKKWHAAARRKNKDDRNFANCGYAMSNNINKDAGGSETWPDVWQLSREPTTRTNHVGKKNDPKKIGGIQDAMGRQTHPDVGNVNSIGIEVQADSIVDVMPIQHKTIVYFCTQKLAENGLIRVGMTGEEIYQAVDRAVIGHGKTHDVTGHSYEFGYTYSRAVVAAIAQFAQQYLDAQHVERNA